MSQASLNEAETRTELISRLEAAGIAVSKSKSGRKAAFCRDYDGNAVEPVEKV
jgi:glyoxylase I family protein